MKTLILPLTEKSLCCKLSLVFFSIEPIISKKTMWILCSFYFDIQQIWIFLFPFVFHPNFQPFFQVHQPESFPLILMPWEEGWPCLRCCKIELVKDNQWGKLSQPAFWKKRRFIRFRKSSKIIQIESSWQAVSDGGGFPHHFLQFKEGNFPFPNKPLIFAQKVFIEKKRTPNISDKLCIGILK